jgi:hypothetical protein
MSRASSWRTSCPCSSRNSLSSPLSQHDISAPASTAVARVLHKETSKKSRLSCGQSPHDPDHELNPGEGDAAPGGGGPPLTSPHQECSNEQAPQAAGMGGMGAVVGSDSQHGIMLGLSPGPCHGSGSGTEGAKPLVLAEGGEVDINGISTNTRHPRLMARLGTSSSGGGAAPTPSTQPARALKRYVTVQHRVMWQPHRYPGPPTDPLTCTLT